jgi:hypothetical protein
MKTFVFSLLVVFFVLSQSNITIAEKKSEETFEAFVTPTGGGAAGNALPIRIVIKGWTTDQEKDQYLSILKSDGQNALLKAIQKNNLGYCVIGSNVGQQLMAARNVQLANGDRKITAIYGSITGTFETRANSKAGDFPFAYIEMFIHPNGQGEGMIAAAVGVTVKPDGSLDLENFGAYPGKLMSLHQQK